MLPCLLVLPWVLRRCVTSALGSTQGEGFARVFVCSEIVWARVGGLVEPPCVGLETGRNKQGSPWSECVEGDTHALPFLWAGPLTSTEKGFFLGMSGGKLLGSLAV